mmetsp:Transcript_4966/g.10308  ORF Transcript_4966/g.10308 Transcript_4966/m.10308 type:complete len:234 (-) Transcript_4966:1029-1730(-)
MGRQVVVELSSPPVFALLRMYRTGTLEPSGASIEVGYNSFRYRCCSGERVELKISSVFSSFRDFAEPSHGSTSSVRILSLRSKSKPSWANPPSEELRLNASKHCGQSASSVSSLSKSILDISSSTLVLSFGERNCKRALSMPPRSFFMASNRACKTSSGEGLGSGDDDSSMLPTLFTCFARTWYPLLGTVYSNSRSTAISSNKSLVRETYDRTLEIPSGPVLVSTASMYFGDF